MTDAAVGHQHRGLVRGRLRGQGVNVRRHDVHHRCIEVDPGRHDPRQQIMKREHPDRAMVVVGYDHRADVVGVHARKRLPDRGAGETGHRSATHQVGKRGAERGVARHLGGERRLRGAQRQIEQIGQAARAEVVKHRTQREQLVEVLAIELEAETVLHRPVHRSHGAAGEQRADRKAFPGHQLPGAFLRGAVFIFGLAAHAPLLDDEEHGGRPLFGRGDALAAGVEAEAQALGQELQVRRAHLVEGRMAQQELHHRREDGVGRGDAGSFVGGGQGFRVGVGKFPPISRRAVHK